MVTGTVIAAADAADPLLKQRVFLTPMRGWEKDPMGPESKYVGNAHVCATKPLARRRRTKEHQMNHTPAGEEA
jgi:hypothetical protein